MPTRLRHLHVLTRFQSEPAAETGFIAFCVALSVSLMATTSAPEVPITGHPGGAHGQLMLGQRSLGHS